LGKGIPFQPIRPSILTLRLLTGIAPLVGPLPKARLF
jgi:hypothetical protein